MVENNRKNGNSLSEEGLSHIEFQGGGEEDPISELVRQNLEQLLAEGEEYTAPAPKADTDKPEATQAAPQPGQSKPPTGQGEIANVAESVVRKKVVSAMEQAGGCTCEHCISDAVALALNSLSPQYMVAPPEQLQARMATYEKENEAKITGAVVSACLKVTGHPRH